MKMKKTPSASRLGFLMGALLSMLATGAPLRAETATPESPPASAQPAPTPVAPPAPAAPSEPAPVTSAPVTSAPPVGAAPAAPQATTPAPAQTAVKKPKPKPAPPRETALSDDPTPALQPQTFFTTSKAADRYRQIVDRGGWPRVGVSLRPGAKGAAVSTLRRRLAAEDESLVDTAKE
ncbi:MAG: murein L,D-transpeptidase, partial [Methylocystis sp.]